MRLLLRRKRVRRAAESRPPTVRTSPAEAWLGAGRRRLAGCPVSLVSEDVPSVRSSESEWTIGLPDGVWPLVVAET